MKIALFDDYVPHVDLGAGLPRANALVNDLARRCDRVAFFAMHGANGDAPERMYRDIDRRVELAIPPVPFDWLPTLQRLRDESFDVLWISRPPNMATIEKAFAAEPDLRAAFTIVYDAEALYAPREVQMRRLQGIPMSAEEEQKKLDAEFALARFANILVSVSPGEAAQLRAATGLPVSVLGFTSMPSPTPAGFHERSNFGFVGPIRPSSPNEDSLLWFGANVLHAVTHQTQSSLRVAGALVSRSFSIYAGARCEVLGPLDDLDAFFGSIRVFVAPTRFAAGLPQKLIDAASAGVPIVATSLLADQLGWTDRNELLVADDADAFARACIELYSDADLWSGLRERAAERIAAAYGAGCFTRELDEILRLIRSR